MPRRMRSGKSGGSSIKKYKSRKYELEPPPHDRQSYVLKQTYESSIRVAGSGTYRSLGTFVSPVDLWASTLAPTHATIFDDDFTASFAAGSGSRTISYTQLTGMENLRGRWNHCWVSSATLTMMVQAIGEGNNSSASFSPVTWSMTPMGIGQIENLTGTFPSLAMPGSDPHYQNSNLRLEPHTRYKTTLPPATTQNRAVLKSHMTLKRFMLPGFPLSSATWWNDLGARTGPTNANYCGWYINLYLQEQASGDQRFNLKFTVELRVTAFDRLLGFQDTYFGPGYTGMSGENFTGPTDNTDPNDDEMLSLSMALTRSPSLCGTGCTFPI